MGFDLRQISPLGFRHYRQGESWQGFSGHYLPGELSEELAGSAQTERCPGFRRTFTVESVQADGGISSAVGENELPLERLLLKAASNSRLGARIRPLALSVEPSLNKKLSVAASLPTFWKA